MTRPLVALALVAVSPALAVANGLEYAPQPAPPPPDAAGLVLRLVGLTAGLLAVCGAVVWFARRAARPTGLKGGGGRLKHEASLPLDRRAAVHLVSVDGQTVAVTTDATGLRALVLLSEPFETVLEAAGAEKENGAAGE